VALFVVRTLAYYAGVDAVAQVERGTRTLH
jgi:hypothetical protein